MFLKIYFCKCFLSSLFFINVLLAKETMYLSGTKCFLRINIKFF